MRALFLCMDMENGLHGSLLHILEYAEYFKMKGYEIHIGSVFISSENRILAESMGFAVHWIKDVPLDENWDIVYALHQFIFPSLLKRGLKYSKAITGTLSAFSGIENLPPASILTYFDLITAVSEEAAYAHIKRYGMKDIFEVIPNHIPLSFMTHVPRTIWNHKPEKVAFISNRPLNNIASVIMKAPFQLDLIGSFYGNTRRVTPELLLEYDGVISIGKTVQYCMSLGIPIFQYGMHGGCGYITPDNMLSEEKTNFSGRGTRKIMEPDRLISEFEVGYAKACESASALCKAARERYDISILIEKQLDLVNRKPGSRPPLKRESLAFADAANTALSYMWRALCTLPPGLSGVSQDPNSEA